MLLASVGIATVATVGTACTAVAQNSRDPAPALVAVPGNPVALPTLPPPPAPLGVPQPGPTNAAPYAPQTILSGGVVMPLYPPGSPHLNADRVCDANPNTNANLNDATKAPK